MGDVSMQLLGDKEVLECFERLSGAAQTRIARDVLKAGATIVLAAADSLAPRASGLLEKALGLSSVKRFPSALFVTVGVRRGFRRAVAPTRHGGLRVLSKKASAAANEGSLRDPAYYINVVTSGRKTVVAGSRTPGAKTLFDSRSGRFFGKTARGVPPNPFMSAAFGQAQGPALAAMQAAAESGVTAAVASQ